MAEAERPRFSLPAPAALREEAQRVGERGRRTGRPRRRFLAERSATLSRGLVLTAGVVAGASAGVALLDVGLSSFPPSPLAVAFEVLVAVALGVVAALAHALRGRERAALWLTIGAGAVASFGWAAACVETGGSASPYLLLIAIFGGSFVHVVPAPPRAALAIGGCMLAAAAVADPRSAAYVLLITLAVAVGGYVVARARHAAALRSFLRTERLGAALARMQRVQEQLVVVEKLEALRVLVGGMAHELNNALTVSQASTKQALKDLETNPELAKAALGRSDGGLVRIKRTIDRLRRFAMAAEGTLEPADVGAMLDFALESAIGRARSGVVVERVYDANVGAIECHVSALAEALFQIARNAIEAMPGGGTIEAAVRRDGDLVVLSVADQGRGIPADQLQRVFDPFFSRAPGKSAQKSGLGLSAVYGLVTALGGKVQIDSEVGKGTVVSISMPAKRVAPRS